jgi:hypothetical protein
MGVEDEGNAGRKGGGSFARPQMQCDCPFLGLKSSLVGKRYGGQSCRYRGKAAEVDGVLVRKAESQSHEGYRYAGKQICRAADRCQRLRSGAPD